MTKTALLSVLLASGLLSAQEFISFEESEGYVLGSINNQSSWEAHADEEFATIESQKIVNDHSTHGTRALKLLSNNTSSDSSPINIIYNLSEASTANNFTISFDLKINEQVSNYNTRTSNYYFSNSVSPYYSETAFHFFFGNDGAIKVMKGMYAGYPSYTTAFATWEPNQWYRVKIEGDSEGTKYYLDGEFIAQVNHFNNANLAIDKIFFRRNNYSNSNGDFAFIDKIAINNEEVLGIQNQNSDNLKISIFPNPASETLKINSNHIIEKASIYNLDGKLLKVIKKMNSIDIKHLPKGAYLISIESEEGTQVHKFIKM